MKIKYFTDKEKIRLNMLISMKISSLSDLLFQLNYKGKSKGFNKKGIKELEAYKEIMAYNKIIKGRKNER